MVNEQRHSDVMRYRFGRLFVLAASIAAVLSSAGPALAQSRAISTRWVIQADESLVGERVVDNRGYVLKQRLLPTGLAELDADLPAAGLKSGDQLVELESDGAVVFCDPQMRPSKMMVLVAASGQYCLVDADGDGAFESMFRTLTATKSILMISGVRPKNPKAIPPVAYRRTDPSRFSMNLFVGVQYRGNAGLVDNHVFQFNFGSDDKFESLTDRMIVKPSALSEDQNPFGSLFRILSLTPNGIRVQVSRAMPAQPFNVEKITTIRFY